jgi:uncharacterized repeat protein (TIGR01451 family)
VIELRRQISYCHNCINSRPSLLAIPAVILIFINANEQQCAGMRSMCCMSYLQVIKGNNNNDLSITKTASPSSGESGTVFTFTIVVTPIGGEVENVIVTDPIPAQLTIAKLLTTFGGELTCHGC